MTAFYRTFCAAFCCIAAAMAQASPKLISTSPEMTELLFQLGKGGDVVATPEFSEFPPAAKKLPVLGPLFAPSIERTARLGADWVLLDTANLSAVYAEAVKALRVPTLTLDLTRVETMFTESRRLLKTIYGETAPPVLDAYQRCWRALPARNQTRKFLAFAWLSPPILVGRGTYLSDLLERVTGDNGLPESLHLPFPQVSEDWLASRAPQVVYLLNYGSAPEEQARALFRKWWPGWHGTIRFLAGDDFSRASLTPLKHLGELLSPLPKECSELP